MSRLFSRLENKGYERNEGAPPADPVRQADTHAGPAVPAPADRGSDTRAPAGLQSPIMQPLVPGYSISSSLGMVRPLEPAVTTPVWPVRLWFASLLLLAGLSLLMLALPERLMPLAARQAPASAAPEPPAAAASATPPANVARPAARSAEPALTAAPAPTAPRAEPPLPAPASASGTAPPSSPADSSACTQAMVAMNLCSKSSP
jgi:hypothetical protein